MPQVRVTPFNVGTQDAQPMCGTVSRIDGQEMFRADKIYSLRSTVTFRLPPTLRFYKPAASGSGKQFLNLQRKRATMERLKVGLVVVDVVLLCVSIGLHLLCLKRAPR